MRVFWLVSDSFSDVSAGVSRALARTFNKLIGLFWVREDGQTGTPRNMFGFRYALTPLTAARIWKVVQVRGITKFSFSILCVLKPPPTSRAVHSMMGCQSLSHMSPHRI